MRTASIFLVPQPLHNVVELRIVFLERGLLKNQWVYKRTLVNINYSTKAYCLEGLTFELKDERSQNFHFCCEYKSLWIDSLQRGEGGPAGNSAIQGLVTFSGSCELFQSGVFIITFLTMTYPLSQLSGYLAHYLYVFSSLPFSIASSACCVMFSVVPPYAFTT